MISFLEGLKKMHTDDASIRAFNEIENQLREKKYGLVWEEHSEEVDDKLKENIPVFCADKKRRLCKDEKLPWNFIIEGDNLQALYLLEKTHKGKVDCIYIDPPYNTGARDWKYNNDYVDTNDVYRHSKWLSMMKNRLHLAKELLNPEKSVLICTIDEKEYLRLGCLLEEVFPNAKIQMISSVINRHGSMRFSEFTRVNEYIYYVRIGNATIGKMLSAESKQPIHWHSLKRSGTSKGNFRRGRPFLFYPIYIHAKTKKIIKFGSPLPIEKDVKLVPHVEGCISVFPIRKDGSEGCWSLSPEKAMELYEKGYLKVGRYNDKSSQQYEITYLQTGTVNGINKGEIEITGYNPDGSIIAYHKTPKSTTQVTQWDNSTHDATEYGTNLLNTILGNRFSYPKSLYAVKDCLYYAINDYKNAVIIDFFAGSGTTGHAVNLLNCEDGGHRRWIMVTNNEISETEEKEFAKRGIKKGDPEWEAKGIAQYVTWPRTVCSIEGKDINDNPLKGNYLGSDIPMGDGFNANVKYFKCEWTPRKPEDYLLSNALALHIKEMIEIQNAIEIDNKKNVLILNKTDFKNIILDKKKYAQIERVWVNQNIIFNAKELKLLQEKGYKYIPKEFFGQELREAAE